MGSGQLSMSRTEALGSLSDFIIGTARNVMQPSLMRLVTILPQTKEAGATVRENLVVNVDSQESLVHGAARSGKRTHGLLMYLKGCGFHLFLVVLSPFLQLVRSIVVALDDDFL
jgi:hypothetical protein